MAHFTTLLRRNYCKIDLSTFAIQADSIFDVLYDASNDWLWFLAHTRSTNLDELVGFCRTSQQESRVLSFPKGLRPASPMIIDESGTMLLAYCKQHVDPGSGLNSWKLCVFPLARRRFVDAVCISETELNRGNALFWNELVLSLTNDFNGLGYDYRDNTWFDVVYDPTLRMVTTVRPPKMRITFSYTGRLSFRIDRALERFIVLCENELKIFCMRTNTMLHATPLSILKPYKQARTHSIHKFCLDLHGRIYLADDDEMAIFILSPECKYLAAAKLTCCTHSITFDPNRGELLVLGVDKKLVLFLANSLVPNTYVWTPERHRFAPPGIRASVLQLLCARETRTDSMVHQLSNELLYSVIVLL